MVDLLSRLARFDALDPALLDDPYPTYARLRAAGPICRAGPGAFAVTRHAEVNALLRDRRLGHEFPEDSRRAFLLAGGIPDTSLQRIISGLEPPTHTRVRRLMGQAFSPALVRRMQERISRWMDGFVAEAAQRGGFDAMTELALPLQTMVACELIGAPVRDRADIVRRAMDVGRVFILVPFAPQGGPGAQDEAAEWLRAYVADLLRSRRRKPGDDLLSRMAAASHGEARLSDDEIIDNAVFLFFAGFETSIHMIVNGCAAFLAQPEQWDRLHRDPSLAAPAVEEILRLDAPIQWVARLTSAPIEVGEVTVRAGRAVLLLLASANHDDRVFDAPARLDIGRHPNPHASFGAGIHTCLGAVLARAQGVVAFTRLAQRFPVLAPAGPTVRRPHPNLRGYSSVPLTLPVAI